MTLQTFELISNFKIDIKTTYVCNKITERNIQDDFESCADILITSYWLYVELGKNI
jgi:hypothetical protein